MLTVWFTPNPVVAGFFIGTPATASFVGVSFKLTLAAIIIGTVIGSPGRLHVLLGPSTGVAQQPLARSRSVTW